MTAGSWIYIGNQGMLQCTYETFAAAAKKHFGNDLTGKLVVSAGLGGMGGAQPLSITMNNGVALIIEIDPARIQKRIDTNYLEYSTESLNDAINKVKKAINDKKPLSVGLLGNAADIIPKLAKRDIIPAVSYTHLRAHETPEHRGFTVKL